MLSQTLLQSPSDLTQEPSLWKNWKYEHPEFKRKYDTKIPFNGDKIFILGGVTRNNTERAPNLILVDPENQTFKIIPSTGDADSCCCAYMSACYWKDSKIVVFGGFDYVEDRHNSTVAIIAIKDLDSESPSAHWEKMTTPTELVRSYHSAHIYQDKMYVFEGQDKNMKTHDIWCLDLTEFTWSQPSFEDHSSDWDDYDYRWIFHENKAYGIQRVFKDLGIILEFDLESMCSQVHHLPVSQIEHLNFEPSPQVIDGKIYFLDNHFFRPKDSHQMRQVLAFDLRTFEFSPFVDGLDSQSWTEIKTESFPMLNKADCILCCNNHLIFHSIVDNGDGRSAFGEFWSLPLNLPKRSKSSSTSATVNKVQQTMKEFLLEAPYSDISFEVESQIIPAHRWLLSQKNTFFANLLSSEMLVDQGSKIIIQDLKAPAFRALLEYLYSDHVEIDDTIALELLQQANKYSIPSELKTACEKHLIQNIEPENYVAFGKLAESIGATSLRDAVVVFIAKNMKKIKPRKDFNEISNALLRDSIVKFIAK